MAQMLRISVLVEELESHDTPMCAVRRRYGAALLSNTELSCELLASAVARLSKVVLHASADVSTSDARICVLGA